MPIGRRKYDFQVANRGYMLAQGEYRGRAWHRYGLTDAPSSRSSTDAKYGNLPSEIDHPEVWDDWSGGFGHAYRKTGQPTYHWAENFDARFPRQLIHCQNPTQVRTAPGDGGDTLGDIQQLIISPPVMSPNVWQADRYNAGIIVRGGYGYWPLVPNSTGSVNIPAGASDSTATERFRIGRMASYKDGIYSPYLDYSGNPHYRTMIRSSQVISTHNLPFYHMIRASDRYWMAVGGSGNMRGALQSNLTDPSATAQLTATLLVGNDSFAITDMAVLDDQLVIGMANGLYFGDQSGTFVNIVPWMEQASHADNFRDLMPWAGGLMAQSTQGVFFYVSSGYQAQFINVTPNSGRSPVRGYIRALGHCGPWVYAGLWTGSSSYLLATSDIPLSGTPRWHTLQSWGKQSIGRIFIDGLLTASGSGTVNIPQRGYIAMSLDHGASAPLYAWPMPQNDDNPLATQVAFSANYIGSARIDLGNVDLGAPGTPKIWRNVELWSENLAASGAQLCQIFYDVDRSGSFTLLGTSTKSPKDTLYFPAGEGSFITGQSIELSLRSFTASAAITPIYRTLTLRGSLQPHSVDVIEAVVRIADNMLDRQQKTIRSGALMLQELRNLCDPNVNGTQAHKLIDLTGAAHWVKFLGMPDEKEYYLGDENNPEIAAKVNMVVLDYV